MRITKFGHCCLLIELPELSILTDPGIFSDLPREIPAVDVVLITHEHQDHIHIASLKALLAHNTAAEVITNSSVGRLLEGEGIAYTVLEGTKELKRNGIAIAAHDGKHEEIFEEIGQVQNTGYMIAGQLFYPGDSFHDPEVPVKVLALPVAGPWCRIKDAIRYALRVAPAKAFPVHDGLITPQALGVFHGTPEKVLSENGIEFTPLKAGEHFEC